MRAFITGGASGIGRATAQLFAAEGWQVGIADRDDGAARALAAELGPDARAYGCDVTDPTSVAAALQDFCAPDGHLDLLVNNAGVLEIGPFEESPVDAHRRLIDVNARGVVEVLHAAFPMLRKARGRVVNLGSASAVYGTPDFATYSATKMFVRGLSEALDVEWRRHGIHVACVMPAFVATPMIAGRTSAAMRRLGVQLSPQDVAAVIWRAAHGPKLMWHVGWKYRLSRLLLQPLPVAVKRASMGWLSSYAGRT